MKKIGGAIYVHRSNTNSLSKEQQEMVQKTIDTLEVYDYKPNYQVVKIDTKSKAVTLIESEDWDNSNEPVVGDAYRVDLLGKIKIMKKKNNPQIYHHKWMFVSEDYTGFDIEESKKRSELWTSIIPKGHSSKIGYKKYWLELLSEYGLN